MTKPLRRQGLIEQTANHLRDGFVSGRWTGQLPGVLRLAGELVVSKHIVRAALLELEKEGSVQDCGAGRPGRIVLNRAMDANRHVLRVAILLGEPLEDVENHCWWWLRSTVRRLYHFWRGADCKCRGMSPSSA